MELIFLTQYLIVEHGSLAGNRKGCVVRMSDYDKTGEQMLQIDHKRASEGQNYRRAEAFLLWKFGGAGYDEARRFLRGSGMDWSVVVR